MVVIEVMPPPPRSERVSHPSGRLQIFTEEWPFSLYSDGQVILLLAEGKRPDEPVHEQFTPKIWSLTKKCWRKDPEKRPDVPKVLKKLESRDGAFSFIHGNLRAPT